MALGKAKRDREEQELLLLVHSFLNLQDAA